MANDAHIFHVILRYKGHTNDCFLPNPPYKSRLKPAASTYTIIKKISRKGCYLFFNTLPDTWLTNTYSPLETYLEQAIEKDKVKLTEALTHLVYFKDVRATTAIQNVIGLG